MARTKLKRFKENAVSENVIEVGKESYEKIKGNWHSFQFKNEHPITLELGCGNGEYSVGLGRLFPDRNIVGVDVKGSRIWRGSKNASEKGLSNVAFLRTSILDLEKFFEPKEVDQIWITFPDPRPRLGDAKRRLTSERFLGIYSRLIVKGGKLHLKSDDYPLYQFTLEALEKVKATIHEYTDDLYHSDYLDKHYGLQTTYEKKFLAEEKKICYIQFELDQDFLNRP